VDEQEILKSARLEDSHWWYAARRGLVRRLVRGTTPGRALDVGAGSGGNAAVLAGLGWDVTALEHSPVAVGLARDRGLHAVRADARRLPFRDGSFDLVMSTDMWEHVDDDRTVAQESFRVLRPGGRLLVAVPAGMDVWSGHDVALGHYRRYERDQLTSLVSEAGFDVIDVRAWNVLLRPAVRLRRSSNTDHSEMEHVAAPLNLALRAVVETERFLPLASRRGLSLVVRAVRR
jgi:SAM-dependent methyltransferase